MRFSEAWLRELVNPEIDTDALSHQLSMAGLEVDSVEKAAPEFHGVVIGEVLTKEQHPDADKLSVTTVDVGEDERLQIVCGAKNVASGMRVPVAIVGAELPGGFKIKKAKLRGVQSSGMICSASELGLADSSEGIMPLPADAPVGADFRDYDGDGLPDIFVTNFGPNVLYRNNGDFTFTNTTAIAGVGETGLNLGTVFGDYDNDGDVDLFVVNYNEPNLLYRNDDGALVEVDVEGVVAGRGTGGLHVDHVVRAVDLLLDR